jgi:adenosylcobinamide kinase/adenosylcobinamide-phosphate guanylyltransferase
LVLGGVKSGKSRHAQQLAAAQASSDNVVYIATARAGDDEMRQRIEQHRKDRPVQWRLIEEPRYLVEQLERLQSEATTGHEAVVLVECLTLWLTQLCTDDLSIEELHAECVRLVDQVAAVRYPLILVSNEVNMGITPLGEFSRRYCDAAGLMHQALASVCDTVTLVVAGLPLPLKTRD